MKFRVIFFKSDGVMYSKIFDFLEDAVFYFSLKLAEGKDRLTLRCVKEAAE